MIEAADPNDVVPPEATSPSLSGKTMLKDLLSVAPQRASPKRRHLVKKGQISRSVATLPHTLPQIQSPTRLSGSAEAVDSFPDVMQPARESSPAFMMAKSSSAGGLPRFGETSTGFWGASSGKPLSPRHDDQSSEDSVDQAVNLQENIRLRKRLHRQTQELQETKNELEMTQRELRQRTCEVDDLRLKLSNLERVDRVKSADLLEERRKGAELSKQVKAMSQNLLSVMQLQEGDAPLDMSGLQKRCFKLVQQNTALSMKASLLSRQKGWAEAKARVLQNEVTQVYLGNHLQVKDHMELETATRFEFKATSMQGDEARMYRLKIPIDYAHRETVVDFLTHVTNTNGQDVLGFLQGGRVYSEGIRSDCLNGLGREFYACWRQNCLLPHVLQSVERMCHLGDYLEAFSSFSLEIMDLLKCAHARMWVADHVQNCLWTCWKDGNASKKFHVALPKSAAGAELSGRGFAAAACVSQKMLNLIDAHKDPRYYSDADATSDGQAMTVMCVPVVKQQKVRVVLEAVNKLQEPHFDPDMDARVLRLLGKISLEVLEVCQENSAASKNAMRKETLLSTFSEDVPSDPLQFLNLLELCLQDIFLSQAVAVHVVSGAEESSTRLQIIKSGSVRKVGKAISDSLKGLVGVVVHSKNQSASMTTKLDETSYDVQQDIVLPTGIGRGVLHTLPIVDGSRSVAVVQFICPEEGAATLGDDGAYHPDNLSHFRIMNQLLNFVKKNLSVLTHKLHCNDDSFMGD